MLIEVTVPYVSHVGKRGERKNLPTNAAKALIAVGRARAVEPDELDGARATRRIYQRRDLQAESTSEPAVVAAVPPEPKEVDDEPKPRARRKTPRKGRGE